MTLIVGINAYHGDAAACVIVDGQLIIAVEEERLRRIKHWAGFPSEAIRYCLSEARVKLADIEHVAINSDPKANLLKKVGFAFRKKPELSLVLDRIRNASERVGIATELEKAFPGQKFKGAIHRVEHHLAHLASCYLVGPFEQAVALSVDGFGDFASAAWGFGQHHRVSVADRIFFPHSLGIFYQAITQYLGFTNYGDEYKVMGLAPYGEPRYIGEMQKLVELLNDGTFKLGLEYFRHHREKIDYEWDGGSPVIGTLYSPELEALLGPARHKADSLNARHKDIARSAQAMYEEAFFHLLRRLHAEFGSDNLVLAGGCAMNSVANGKVGRQSDFKKVYVQSAAGDAGGAIGAALVAWIEVGGQESRFVMNHAYWGPEFRDEEIDRILKGFGDELVAENCRVEYISNEDELCRKTARAIAEGQVVGWFQGRMEWGPRALGNRSILGDPRRADMKDILNAKIKRRESFRPFAPSILREAVSEWFEENDDVPFMMQVFQIRTEKRAEIPAVTHVDGSGRLQTVDRSANPRYYRLIECFRDLTKVPMVLNTSFNENEPVVCRPEEAISCFLRTRMDVLVLGCWWVWRDVRDQEAT